MPLLPDGCCCKHYYCCCAAIPRWAIGRLCPRRSSCCCCCCVAAAVVLLSLSPAQIYMCCACCAQLCRPTGFLFYTLREPFQVRRRNFAYFFSIANTRECVLNRSDYICHPHTYPVHDRHHCGCFQTRATATTAAAAPAELLFLNSNRCAAVVVLLLLRAAFFIL